MSGFSIRHTLLAGTASVFALLVAVIVVGALGMTQMAERNADVFTITTVRKAVHSIVIDTFELQNATHSFVNSGARGDLDAYKSALARVEDENQTTQRGATKRHFLDEIAPLETKLQSATSLLAQAVAAEQAGRH